MGVKYEYNWYLIVAKYEELKEVNNDVFMTTKSEARIYPINSEIPLIVKNEGCLGLVRINKFTISEKETVIYFQYAQKFDFNNNISKHYYNQYLAIKNR